MKVTVQFEAQLQAAAGRGEFETEVAEGRPVLTVLQQIAVSCPEVLRERLFDEDGAVRSSLLMFVNEQPIASELAAEHALHDGDVVLLLPPISGG